MEKFFFVLKMFLFINFLTVSLFFPFIKARRFFLEEQKDNNKFIQRDLVQIPQTNTNISLIYLGEQNYHYITPAINKDGDLYVASNGKEEDSAKNTTNRYFYVIKTNGEEYSFILNAENEKDVSEHLFITNPYDKIEYLFTISSGNYYIEVIDFSIKKIYYQKITEFNGFYSRSSRNPLFYLKSSTDSNFTFLYGYIKSPFLSYLSLINYSFTKATDSSKTDLHFLNILGQSPDITTYLDLESVRCFETKSHYIECLYIDLDTKIKVVIFNNNLAKNVVIEIDSAKERSPNKLYNKCIHLKDDVGVFFYYDSTINNQPKLQILNLEKNGRGNWVLNKYKPFIGDKGENFIIINRNNIYDLSDIYSHNKNDLNKISEQKFFIVILDSKKIIFVLYTFMDNDNYLIEKYFVINNLQFTPNGHLSSFIFKERIGLSFYLSDLSKKIYTGFLIFNYANSTDSTTTIFNDNYTFIFKDHNRIENNFFKYKLIGIKILKVPDYNDCGIFIVSNQRFSNNYKKFAEIDFNEEKLNIPFVIKENDTLSINDSIRLIFSNNVKKGSYLIEYQSIMTNPDYNDYIKLFSSTNNYCYNCPEGNQYNDFEFNNYIKRNYTGRMGKFNFTINSNINEECTNSGCTFCLYRNLSECFKCKNDLNYYFIENTDQCVNVIPDRYYLNITEKLFKKCHSKCSLCDKGPYKFSENCLSCIDKDSYVDENNNCQKIPENTNSTNCSQEGCILCNYYNRTKCFECDNNNNYYFIEKIMICAKEPAPSHYYLDKKEKLFKKCQKKCDTCNIGPDSYSDNCLSCLNSSFLLYQGNCFPPCEIEKCKICNKESKENNLCITCNEEKDFYPKFTLNKTEYINCFNKLTPPVGYYFDKDTKDFRECYETCRTCEGGGNQNQHNCTTCVDKLRLDIDGVNKKNKNCILDCGEGYFYYYTENHNYKCTEVEQCPEGMSLLIAEKKKCINNCLNDNDYLYQYNSKCLEKCIPGTQSYGNDNICKDINKNICSLTNSNYNVNIKNLTEDRLEVVTKNYAKEFNYTLNHVSLYQNENYTITLYKNIKCLDELELNTTKIDFGTCLQKLKNYYGLSEIIISIIDIYNTEDDDKDNNESPKLIYNFIQPRTGIILELGSICDGETVTLERSILSIPNLNGSMISYFALQNINVFNENSSFFTDICYHYESPNGKDIPLKDRLNTFYPNIELCDKDCESKGVNMSTLRAICDCMLKSSLVKEIISNNPLVANEAISIVTESNIEVLKCYKDVFRVKFFKKNIGGFLVLGVIIAEIVCIALYYGKSLLKISKLSMDIMYKYIDYIDNKKKKSNKNNNKDNKIIKENEDKDKNKNKTIDYINKPPLDNNTFFSGIKKNNYIKNKTFSPNNKNECNNCMNEKGINNPPPKKANSNNKNKYSNDNKIEKEDNKDNEIIQNEVENNNNNINIINEGINKNKNRSHIKKLKKKKKISTKTEINVKIKSNNLLIINENTSKLSSCSGSKEILAHSSKVINYPFNKNNNNKNNNLNNINNINNINNYNKINIKEIKQMHSNKSPKTIKIQRIMSHRKTIYPQEKVQPEDEISKCQVIIPAFFSKNIFKTPGTSLSSSNIKATPLLPPLSLSPSPAPSPQSTPSSSKREKPSSKFYISKFLVQSLDSLELEDSLIYDKRTICQLFIDKIKVKQIFLYIFIQKDKFIPITIKFLLLLSNILFLLIVDGLLFNEDYISKVFNSDKKENFWSFIPRLINNFIYSSLICLTLDSISRMFFPSENKLKRILTVNKNNKFKLKYEVSIWLKRLKIHFLIFICILGVLSIFGWYYLSCFNNVYPNTKNDWIKMNVLEFLIIQVLSIISSFVYAVSKKLSIKYESEMLFKLSQSFS